MSPVEVPTGMTLPAYLDQDVVWVDGRSGTVFEIAGLDTRRSGYAARELARAATAIISLVETWELMHGDLVATLQLVATPPREWITKTPLYQALNDRTHTVVSAVDDRDADGEVVLLPQVVDVPGPRPRPVPQPRPRRDLAS